MCAADAPDRPVPRVFRKDTIAEEYMTEQDLKDMDVVELTDEALDLVAGGCGSLLDPNG